MYCTGSAAGGGSAYTSPYSQTSSYAAAYAAAAVSSKEPFPTGSCNSNSIASLRLKAKQHYEGGGGSGQEPSSESFMTGSNQQDHSLNGVPPSGSQQGSSTAASGAVVGPDLSPRSQSTNSGSPLTDVGAGSSGGCHYNTQPTPTSAAL